MDSKVMTPNDIEVLLHCHTSGEAHPNIGAVAVCGALKKMESNGLIEPTPGNILHLFQTTDRGRAHVAQLCGLAWPQLAWTDESGKII
ncbi:MAG: hypothetical protein IH951_11710 [Bacteroidetes bacterium]|nr:hypothetical protein [Bacteroidota bacterium]